MHVFLTGATGFIGSAVAASLLRAGHRVTGLARSDQAAAMLSAQGVTPHRGALDDLDGLARGAAAADAVVNTASIMSFGPERGEVEMAAVRAMLAALQGTGKTFVYTSDQLIYGPTGLAPATEDTPLNPLPFVAWRPAVERLVMDAPGVKSVVLRPVAVYGHGRDHLMPMLIGMAKQAGIARYVNDGSARWSMVHVDDVGEGYRLALEKAPGGAVYNFAAEPPVSFKELAEVASRVAGLGGRTEGLPIEQAAQIMGPLAYNFTFDLVVSAAKARRELGWLPTGPTLRAEADAGAFAHLAG